MFIWGFLPVGGGVLVSLSPTLPDSPEERVGAPNLGILHTDLGTSNSNENCYCVVKESLMSLYEKEGRVLLRSTNAIIGQKTSHKEELFSYSSSHLWPYRFQAKVDCDINTRFKLLAAFCKEFTLIK